MTGHPAWCSPRRCEVTDDLPQERASHRSESIDLDVRGLWIPHRVIKAASAQLVRVTAPWPTNTFLVLVADGEEISMPLHAATTVLTQLTELAGKEETR
jgi:hypothetical protein